MSLEAEVASLRAMLTDVVNKRSSESSRTPSVQNEAPGATVQPFWSVVETSATIGSTAGQDWVPQFDDVSLADRFTHSIVTAFGSFAWIDARSNLASRFQISWDADSPYEVNCFLGRSDYYSAGSDGDGDVQVTFNGVRTEYDLVWEYITLNVKKGRNVLIIVRPNDFPDSIRFAGDLFDGKHARFVDPRRA